MKKTSIILLLLFAIFFSFGQPIKRGYLEATNTLVADLYFVWRGDTINFSNLADENAINKTDSTVVFTTPTQVDALILASPAGHSALTLGDSAQSFFSLTDQELEFDYGNLLLKHIYDIDDDSIVDNSEKLSGHSVSETPYGVLWNENDSIPTMDVIYDKISSMAGTIYVITLPASSVVSGRCSGAVEGTDYPTGWVLEAGSSTIDLKITHNLARGVANVVVKSVFSGITQKLTFTNAYNTFNESSDKNILTLKAFAPTSLAVEVYITFAQ